MRAPADRANGRWTPSPSIPRSPRRRWPPRAKRSASCGATGTTATTRSAPAGALPLRFVRRGRSAAPSLGCRAGRGVAGGRLRRGHGGRRWAAAVRRHRLDRRRRLRARGARPTRRPCARSPNGSGTSGRRTSVPTSTSRRWSNRTTSPTRRSSCARTPTSSTTSIRRVSSSCTASSPTRPVVSPRSSTGSGSPIGCARKPPMTSGCCATCASRTASTMPTTTCASPRPSSASTRTAATGRSASTTP